MKTCISSSSDSTAHATDPYAEEKKFSSGAGISTALDIVVSPEAVFPCRSG
jgi:hypothetical protein